jgi:hypothetical protein
MKKLEVVWAIGAVISLAGPAAAQGVYLDLGPGPGPRPYYRPATTGRAGIIALDGLEPGTGASRAGRSKTVFVNRTGAVKRQLNTGA